MWENKTEKRVVLITGGTKGIGLATALRFASEGDRCILTYGWGSVEEEEIVELFQAKNCEIPYLKQANVISSEDTEELLEEVRDRYGSVDVFVSNVSFANLIKNLDDYSEKGLLKSIEYSTWPLVEYPKQMKKLLGSYPKYVIGLSSHGPNAFHTNYDFAAVTKSIMEVLVRYLNYHFFDKDTIFNIVRTRPIITDSLLSTFGDRWSEFIAKFDISGCEVSPEEVAKVVYMLCSGYMDGIRGQTIVADKGYDFADGLQRIYNESI